MCLYTGFQLRFNWQTFLNERKHRQSFDFVVFCPVCVCVCVCVFFSLSDLQMNPQIVALLYKPLLLSKAQNGLRARPLFQWAWRFAFCNPLKSIWTSSCGMPWAWLQQVFTLSNLPSPTHGTKVNSFVLWWGMRGMNQCINRWNWGEVPGDTIGLQPICNFREPPL